MLLDGAEALAGRPRPSVQLLEWADGERRLRIRANADTPRDARVAARPGRPGDRPLPHRAHVLRRRAHPLGAADDPGRRRGDPRHGPGQAPAHAAAGLRGDLRGPRRACRSPSACSIRRSTSSCRTSEKALRGAGGADGDRPRRGQGAGRGAGRGQPHARACAAAAWASPCPEIYEMQVEAIVRAACVRAQGGGGGAAGDHGPAGGHRGGDGAPAGDDRGGRRPRPGGGGGRARDPDRHHDRGAAGGPGGRQDRRATPTSSPSAPTT